MSSCMGFGSYDESEQANQDLDTDFDNGEAHDTETNAHSGSVEFDIGASNDELLDRLQKMKASDDTDVET